MMGEDREGQTVNSEVLSVLWPLWLLTLSRQTDSSDGAGGISVVLRHFFLVEGLDLE